MIEELQIRFASRRDRGALLAMQAESLRTLGAAYYEDDVIEAFIENPGTMDVSLLDERNYFVALIGDEMVGCGGWTRRTPGYAARMAAAENSADSEAATVRSVYVHPRWARRGIARSLMKAIECDIRAAGFEQTALVATLSGIPLYRRLGYRCDQPVSLSLPGARTFVGLAMRKALTRVPDTDRRAA